MIRKFTWIDHSLWIYNLFPFSLYEIINQINTNTMIKKLMKTDQNSKSWKTSKIYSRKQCISWYHGVHYKEYIFNANVSSTNIHDKTTSPNIKFHYPYKSNIETIPDYTHWNPIYHEPSTTHKHSTINQALTCNTALEGLKYVRKTLEEFFLFTYPIPVTQ